MPYTSRWSVPVPQCSLPTFLFHSPTYPLGDEVAFVEAARPDTHFLTRNQFRLWSQRLGKGLVSSQHFKPGDRILLFSGNDLFVPVVVLGTLCAGGIFTGANPTFTARELANQLIDSGATYLFCADASLDTGIEAAKQAGMEKDRIFVFNNKIYDGSGAPGIQSQKGCKHWSKLVAPAEESRDFQWPDLRNPGECHTTLALNYSSGTTGKPKGVEITHYNYISNTVQVAQVQRNHPDYKEREKQARWLCYLPLYHAYGQTVFTVNSFYRSIPVYVMPKFDFILMLEYVQRFKISEFHLVPPIAVMLANHPVVDNYDLSSIIYATSGAAPLGSHICTQVEKRIKSSVNVRQAWGMTETTCSLLSWDINKRTEDGSVGEPNANCEAKIMAEDGSYEITQRGPEHPGELWCRGPNIMKGYWKNPTATAQTLTPDGWLKTGDIAYVDQRGMFWIVDRLKELIKVKGNQVAPAELEALLLEHPAIVDVAVIGIPTEDGDEAPAAFVVKKPDSKSQSLTQEEVAHFVQDKVVRYKRLTGGVHWMDAIPKNPSGKILRRQIRDAHKAKLSKQGYIAISQLAGKTKDDTTKQPEIVIEQLTAIPPTAGKGLARL